MKFLKPNTILVGGVLVSLFTGAIFVSCHSMATVSAESSGYSHDVLVTQSLNDRCCMVQGGNYSLHSSPLAVITSTTPSQNNVFVVTGGSIWFQDAVIRGTHTNQELYLGSTAEMSLYNYLISFIASGLLHPLIYNTPQASV